MIVEMSLYKYAQEMGVPLYQIIARYVEGWFLPGNLRGLNPPLNLIDAFGLDDSKTLKVKVDLRLIEAGGGKRNMKHSARIMNVYLRGEYIGQLQRCRRTSVAHVFMCWQCPELGHYDIIIKYADIEKKRKEEGKPSGNYFYSKRTNLRLIEVYYNGQLKYIDEDSLNINTAREKYFETHPLGGGFFARYKRENQKPYGYMAKKKAAIAAKKQAEIDAWEW